MTYFEAGTRRARASCKQITRSTPEIEKRTREIGVACDDRPQARKTRSRSNDAGAGGSRCSVIRGADAPVDLVVLSLFKLPCGEYEPASIAAPYLFVGT